MIVAGILASFFSTLSQRYTFNDWDEFRKHNSDEDAKLLKESYKPCGKVVDIEVQRGGFFSNDRVTLKTEDAIYNCVGRVSEIRKGSDVKRQYNDLIVIDDGKEKRLELL